MSPQLGLLLGYAFVLWLFRMDMRWRRLSSPALWIPGIWLTLLSSRQLSFWLNMAGIGSGGSTNLEGNPVNAVFNTGLFSVGVLALHHRQFSWKQFASENKALFSIFAYFLISTLWSPFPLPTLKRLVQEFGCVLIAPIILTEKDPNASLRVVFARVSYVLFPLSVVFIKYFPQIGRNISPRSGAQLLCGVADHKNTLGQMTMTFCLVLLCDLLESWKHEPDPKVKPNRWPRLLNLGIGLYLLVICQSATALVCFIAGAALLFVGKRLSQMQNAKHVIITGVLAVVFAMILNNALGISGGILNLLGRDESLTGRTDIWQKILEKDTSPLVGAGFRGFWESSAGESVYKELAMNRILEAHNGYLEVYLYGGLIALFLLSALIWSTGSNAANKLIQGDPIGRFAVIFWPILLISNVSESNFFMSGPLWFVTLMVTANYQCVYQNRIWENNSSLPIGRTKTSIKGPTVIAGH